MGRMRFLVSLVVVGLLAASALAVAVVGCDEPPPPTTGSSGARQYDEVDGYVALVPSVLRSGETASFSFTLTHKDEPAYNLVSVEVLDKGKTLASQSAEIDGTGTVAFELPAVSPGEYEVRWRGRASPKPPGQIQAGTLLFLETDKPIYKPGQTIMMRLVALDSELKPVQAEATLEVQDAKGVKIFKQVLATDEYGTVTAELPLSTEPNLGTWKLTATAGNASTQLDVRVEKYVLPKYEVKAELPRSGSSSMRASPATLLPLQLRPPGGR